MKKIFFLAIIFLSFQFHPAAQMTPELRKKIGTKRNLKAIMREVEEYFEKEERENERKYGKDDVNNNGEDEKEFESGLLKWKRWEYFNATRLKPNGDLEDIEARTVAAWEQVNAKYGNTNRIESGTDATWTFMGPGVMNYQGGFYRGLSRTDRIVFHPTDANTFYVCANNGGLWRTTNAGVSWTCLTFNFPILSAAGVVINPSNTNNIWVLTGDAKSGNGVFQNSCGLWVTYDGGFNWFKTNFNGNALNRSQSGYKLVMMPGNPSILFAATASGLYRSVDGGINWVTALSGGTVFDIEFDPSNAKQGVCQY